MGTHLIIMAPEHILPISIVISKPSCVLLKNEEVLYPSNWASIAGCKRFKKIWIHTEFLIYTYYNGYSFDNYGPEHILPISIVISKPLCVLLKNQEALYPSNWASIVGFKRFKKIWIPKEFLICFLNIYFFPSPIADLGSVLSSFFIYSFLFSKIS